jgi:hypothetical protein
MAKGGVDRYFKRSGAGFYRMEHFDIEDMFGRRKKAKLVLKPVIVRGGGSDGPQGRTLDLQVVLGIENTGRGSAKSPFLEISIRPPYKFSTGILGNTRIFDLKELISAGGPYQRRLGASSDAVIHPGTNPPRDYLSSAVCYAAVS